MRDREQFRWKAASCALLVGTLFSWSGRAATVEPSKPASVGSAPSHVDSPKPKPSPLEPKPKKVSSKRKATTGKPRKTGKTGKTKKSKTRSRPPEFPGDADDSPACTYARMNFEQCRDRLTERGIPFARIGPTAGVEMPVRLGGPVGSVVFRTDYPDSQRPTTPFEVFDCRLVLAIADFARILKSHDVVEVRMFSAYRPPSKNTKAGDGTVLTGHPGGLAADLRLFKKSSGESLEVLKDFHGHIGKPPCGRSDDTSSSASPAAPPSQNAQDPQHPQHPQAPQPQHQEPAQPATQEDGPSNELRSILCEGARARLFHVLLSPNFDGPHQNHFHVEVRPKVHWFIVR
jgi:hypothetical protein